MLHWRNSKRIRDLVCLIYERFELTSSPFNDISFINALFITIRRYAPACAMIRWASLAWAMKAASAPSFYNRGIAILPFVIN